MGFPVGTYRWEAETLEGIVIGRHTGHSTSKLKPKDLRLFRLTGNGLLISDLIVDPGLLVSGLEFDTRSFTITCPEQFDSITLTLRKQFPLGTPEGMTEDYLVRALGEKRNVFIFLRPGRTMVSSTEPILE